MSQHPVIGGGILGGTILGGGLIGGDGDGSGTPNLYRRFWLELRNPDNERIGVLRLARNVQRKDTLNEPSTLDFELPADSEYLDDCAPPNHVALYNGMGELIQIYEIMSESAAYGDTSVRRFGCCDPMCLLNDDSVAYKNYTTEGGVDGDPKTAVLTLVDLLNAQSNTRKILFGSMDAVLAAKAFRIGSDESYATPLALINDLRDVVGGYFRVTPDLRLHWKESSNNGREVRQIRWKRNMQGYEQRVDYDGVVTHLRYLGEKSGPEQVSLPSPGYLVSPYYLDGGRKYWHTEVDGEIRHQDTLVEVATLFHKQFWRPEVSATVNLLDLSQSPGHDYDEWYGVEVGDQVNVHHPKLGDEPMALTVVGRSVQLDKPMNVDLDLGVLPLNLARIVADIRAGYTRRNNGTGGGGGGVAGFETDPGVFAPPGTPATVDVGTSPNTIRADAVLPILPDLGTYTPEPVAVGPGAPGIGPYAAPQDHVHPLDPSEIKTDFEGDGFVTDDNFPDYLSGALTDPLNPAVESALDGQIEDWASDDEPRPVVAESPAAGSLDKFARADHTHLGQPWIVDENKASLPTTEPDGVIGYTNGEDLESPWFRVAGQWVQPKIYLGTVTTLPPIPASFPAEVTYGGQLWTARPGGTLWRPMEFQTTLSGSPG